MEGTLEELRRISNCPEGATFSQLSLRKSVARYSASSESCRSMKPTKARALALACRPVGNTAQSSAGGNDQSASTTLTAPDFSSGVNIHSDPPTETPRQANTAY